MRAGFLMYEENALYDLAFDPFKFSPLVRRCNGTTAGPGYWKVGLEWPYNTPPGQ